MLTIALTDGSATGVGGWNMNCAWRDVSDLSRRLSAEERARCDSVRPLHAADARRAAHGLKHEMRQRHQRLPHISLSHANGAVAVAASAHAVGVDVEPVGGDDDVARLAARYFPAETARMVWSSKDPRRTFAIHWTAREALLKACALSFTQAMASRLPFDTPALPFVCMTAATDITVFAPSSRYICAVVRRTGPVRRTVRTSR